MIIFAYCLAMALGAIAGFFPGISIIPILIVLIPIISVFEPLHFFGVISCVLISSQYMASVLAAYYGVAGEPSTALTAQLASKLTKQGYYPQVNKSIGISSLIGGVISILFVLVVSDFLQQVVFLSPINKTVLFVSVLSLIFVISTTRKTLFTNLLCMTVGVFLSLIGIHPQTSELRFVFHPELYDGISIAMIAIAFFAGAELYEIIFKNMQLVQQEIVNEQSNLRPNFKVFSVIGSFIGSIIGLIPGCGPLTASLLSLPVAKILSKKPNANDNSINQIICIEAANNAAAQTGMFILLLCSIPTTGFLSVVSGLSPIFPKFSFTQIFQLSFIILCFNALFCFIIYKFFNTVKFLKRLPNKWVLASLILTAVIASVAIDNFTVFNLLLMIFLICISMVIAASGGNIVLMFMSFILFRRGEDLYLRSKLLYPDLSMYHLIILSIFAISVLIVLFKKPNTEIIE